jgi:hypothetical protein
MGKLKACCILIRNAALMFHKAVKPAEHLKGQRKDIANDYFR